MNDIKPELQVFAVVSFTVIVISTLTFLLGVFMDEGDEGNSGEDGTSYKGVLTIIDNAALAFFTVEYLTRLASAPSFCRWMRPTRSSAQRMFALTYLSSTGS